jgi:DNA helicase TIP49 (TBP-interacting protein)
MLEHFDGRFVDQHRNVVFTGPPGTGKSHCLVSLGIAARTRGYRVRFTTAAELLMQLIEAKKSGTLQRTFRSFDRIDLLLIDLCVVTGYVELVRPKPAAKGLAPVRLHITSTIAAYSASGVTPMGQ